MPSIIISQLDSTAPAHGSHEREFASLAAAAGLDALLVPALYSLPDESPVWARLGALGDVVAVVGGLYPRPLGWLLRRHGIGIGDDRLFNLNAFSTPADCLAALRTVLPTEAAITPGTITEIGAECHERWYPVIDGTRCMNCHHCLQFCLFGVYELDASGQVTVCHPDRCKPGCPACSRICPEGAIMFPLYAKDAAIAGAPGLVMAPDLAARRMFYTRTGRPCPACGQAGVPPRVPPETDTCPECGRALPAKTASDELDDIDALIAALDDLAQRRP